ncbi:LOW QUALITY PROTEIN: cortactin-binding protein 2 [Plectropomus leopardus]|uniref:LOW QUALITY PROTEIN: cortactin-binding protein 2 n=1 Tax=Plectropomus leopardus TaxID=160734 RepID=UPI001C4BB57D|nr:LOW QUALITY PROTEIN: cortactin-binding protein 2 [Plectropomus leopardus]
MSAGCALTSADRYSTKMASEGASGEQPPPVQTLATAVLGSVDTKCEFNMDNLSKPELLTLLSIMEGELEARDLVIEALRAQRKEVFLQERYGHYSLTDPFLALQRDFECGVPGGDKERRPLGSSPISVLEAVMAHCRKMQERMSAQLAAAESRQKRLEMEKLQLQSLEQEHRKLTAQLKDEREKNKHIVMMLVRECKQLATRVVEESQRFDELQARLDEESRTSGRLQEELSSERQRSQQMEAKMEKQLSEFDTEREQLRARLGREEVESHSLRQQVEQLRTEQGDGKDGAAVAQPAAAGVEPAAATSTPPKPKAVTSVSVATEPISSRTASCQTDLPPTEVEGPKKNPLTIPVKPTPANYVGLSLPKTSGRGIVHSSSGGLAQTENGSEGQAPHGLPSGVSPRVQAARYKFQEQDQNGTASQSPPARDLSPTNRDNFAAKQQARHTVTQVLSRFTSPPAGGGGPLRPGLPHSASEGGPFPGRLSHPIGIKSPTVARIDRGNPPPIPPKKPGLSQTPSPPHPPIKVVGDSSRSPGAGLKPATPQLPPKPALDLVPALTATQVGACPPSRSPGPGRGPQRQPAAACAECPPVISPATTVNSPSSINPPSTSSSISASSSRSPRASAGSPLATASGWCPSVVSSLSGGGPAALDGGRPLLPQAASQGNVTLLSMLLNQPDPTTIITTSTSTNTTSTTNSTSLIAMEDKPNHLDQDHHLYHNQTSALFAAAQNGHTECVKLLLSSGSPADVSDENGFTPLHFAAAHGHSSCVEVLLSAGAAVDSVATGGQTSLFLACEAGRLHCVQVLLSAGADRSCTTTDGCTTLHAAVRSGHVDTLRLILCHPSQGDPTVTSDLPATLALPADLLNHANSDGWTSAHMAAALGLKECLEVLCSHSEQDIGRRDKCNRTIHDVATDDCKDLLENLHSYRVLVRLQCSGGGGAGSMCPVEALEEEAKCVTSSHLALGRVSVDRSMRWCQLHSTLSHAFTSYLQTVCGECQTAREEAQRPPLGLGPASIASILIGDTEWLPNQELPLSPWDLVRKPLSQCITIRLKGLSESCLDELALEYLFPLPLLHNYVRLVEQYGNLIFHGLEGSCQEYIANLVAHCIKSKQEAGRLSCDVVRVEVEESLTKEQLLETFISCGFLVPVVGSGIGVPEAHSTHCVVVLLEGLEKTSSLTGLLGDLCHSLDNRGSASPLVLNTGPHYFCEGSFLIATLSKPRLQGSELRLQQHFRWVTLRWDQEPVHGLLGRHLRRKLLHKVGTGVWSPDGVMERSVLWVSQVWQQLNACLSRLGTDEALLGPQLFLSCPVVPNNTQAVVRWLARLWNAVVVPRVEAAIISRVTARRSSSSTTSSSSSSSQSSQRPSPSNCGLSAGQQAVVKAALSILVNKAVLQGCPLPRHEIDRYLLEFRGGNFPLSAISSYKGSGGGGGGRKGRDSSKLRRSNTSPRKKGGPALSWSSGGSFREGSLSSTDVSFPSNGKVQRAPGGLSVFSDDETDLIRELQTMCSSKSEPDISKISQAKDDLILFSCSPSEVTPSSNGEQETAVQQQPQMTVLRQSRSSSSQAAVQTSDRRSGPRAKSQLPIPSSRGQQTRASTAASSSNNNGSSSPSRTQTPPSRSRTTNSSSRTKQAPPSSNNNYYRNNINDNNQSHEDIWILHRDLHENNNSK